MSRLLHGNPIAFPYNGPFKSEDYNSIVNALHADLNTVSDRKTIELGTNKTLETVHHSGIPNFVYVPRVGSFAELENIRIKSWNEAILPRNIYPYRDKDINNGHIAHIRNSVYGKKKCYVVLNIGYADKNSVQWNSSWNTDSPVWLGAETSDPQVYKVSMTNLEWRDIIEEEIYNIMELGPDGFLITGIDAILTEPVTGSALGFLSFVCTTIKSKSFKYRIILHDNNLVVNVNNFAASGSIDGVLKENLYFSEQVERAESTITSDITGINNTYLERGKSVYIVEYITNATQQIAAKNNCDYRGYRLYIAGTDKSKVYISQKYPPSTTYAMTYAERLNHYSASGAYIRKVYV